ncbi:MAG: hypothetical protein AAFN07_16240, partial [Pseudomonadota bacterium]
RFDVDVWQYAEFGSYARLRIDGAAERLYFSSDSNTLETVVDDQVLTWRMPQGSEYAVPEPQPLRLQADQTPSAEPTEYLGAAVGTLREATGRLDRRAVLICEKLTRGGCSRRLESWDKDVLRGTLELEPVLNDTQASFLTFSGDDDYLIVASRTKLRILEWQTLDEVASLFVNQVAHAAVSPGLQRAATLDADGTARIWNLADDTRIAQFKLDRQTRAMALSDDNRWLAVLTDGGQIVELYALSPPDLINQACRWLAAPCPNP